jgi:hypothetical protein
MTIFATLPRRAGATVFGFHLHFISDFDFDCRERFDLDK